MILTILECKYFMARALTCVVFFFRKIIILMIMESPMITVARKLMTDLASHTVRTKTRLIYFLMGI